MLKVDLEFEIGKFRNYLLNSKNILLVGQEKTNWDHFGSMQTFRYLLKNKGYKVKAINKKDTSEVLEFDTSEVLEFLDDKEIFDFEVDPNDFEPDLIIGFSVSSTKEFGEVYKKNLAAFDNTTYVTIDHHFPDSAFGNINVIDTNSSSTCEIVWDVIKRFGWEKDVDSKIATFLLMGIVASTNSFFKDVNSKTFLSAQELMMYKPKYQEIIVNLFKKKSYNKLKLWGKVLENLRDINNGKIIRNTIPKSLFIQTGTTSKDLYDLIDELLITIDTMEIGFLLYELDYKKIKGSFRGKTDKIDLGQFCLKWGGGGHKRAGEFIIEGKNIFEIEKEVILELSKSLSLKN